MKLRNYFFLSLILLASFLTMDYIANQKILRLKNPQNEVVYNSQNKNQMIALESAKENKNVTRSLATEESRSLLQFKSDFKYEVFQIGQTQANPDQIENRLQSLARQMEPEHRLYLNTILSDSNTNGDDRAMAIELLSRNQTPESVEILKNYSISEANVAKAQIEQEMVHKAQAIEGLTAYQDRSVAIAYLDEVTKKTSYKFIKDRAQRAGVSLKNQGPRVEEQDLEALRKIVK